MSSYKLLGRYTKVFPVTLFRLQSSASVKLKEYYRQQKQNKPSFDFKIGKDGLVHPMTSDEFVIPNGISMRPIGQMLETILRPFHGKWHGINKR
ncbi:unnamed protein product [Brachionus calyciflorus]|uniref:Tse2 ADP-ribosyltransferase toxin domain-containing protein n=1 Tax=Brachionus calyciflorus TaxID=104777 RepID=A0A814B0Q7_9BILA|nr:unnamed protein product [Brachionus calyciflorus]